MLSDGEDIAWSPVPLRAMTGIERTTQKAWDTMRDQKLFYLGELDVGNIRLMSHHPFPFTFTRSPLRYGEYLRRDVTLYPPLCRRMQPGRGVDDNAGRLATLKNQWDRYIAFNFPLLLPGSWLAHAGVCRSEMRPDRECRGPWNTHPG